MTTNATIRVDSTATSFKPFETNFFTYSSAKHRQTAPNIVVMPEQLPQVGGQELVQVLARFFRFSLVKVKLKLATLQHHVAGEVGQWFRLRLAGPDQRCSVTSDSNSSVRWRPINKSLVTFLRNSQIGRLTEHVKPRTT